MLCSTWYSFEPFRRGKRTKSVAAPEASIRTIVRRVRSSKGSIWPYSRPVRNIMKKKMINGMMITCLIV